MAPKSNLDENLTNLMEVLSFWVKTLISSFKLEVSNQRRRRNNMFTNIPMRLIIFIILNQHSKCIHVSLIINMYYVSHDIQKQCFWPPTQSSVDVHLDSMYINIIIVLPHKRHIYASDKHASRTHHDKMCCTQREYK